jgi:hypothetical protein
MSRYRKVARRVWMIDARIWADPAFQDVWAQRFSAPIHVPKHIMYRARWERPLTRVEIEARSKRCRFTKLRAKLRPIVAAALGEICTGCATTDGLLLDHVVPIAWGGTNDPANFQFLCGSCNSAKAGQLPVPPSITACAA